MTEAAPVSTAGLNARDASAAPGASAPGSEVKNTRHADPTSTLNAPPGPANVVMVPMDRANLEMLRKLEAAGILNLGATPVLETDSRLVTWTWDDVEKWMRSPVRNGRRAKPYSDSTVYNTLRHAKRVAQHPEAPVRLWPPDESSWPAHIEHVLNVEGKNESVLENPRKALHIVVEKFLGLHWPSLDEAFEQPNRMRDIPTPEMAWRLCTEKLAWFRYDDSLFRHFNWLSWHVGQRTASEGTLFQLDRVQWPSFTALDVYQAAIERDEAEVVRLWKSAQRSTCRLTYVQPKKRMKANYRVLRPDVVASQNTPSLFNWIVYHLAPWHERQGIHPTQNVVFPMFDGRVWPANYFGNQLAEACKQIWRPFTTYCWRPMFGVELLIEIFEETGVWDIDRVAVALDDDPRTVKRYYVRQAELRYQETLGAGARRPNRRST